MRRILVILFVPMMMYSMKDSRYFDADPQVQIERTWGLFRAVACVGAVEFAGWGLGCPVSARETFRFFGCVKYLYDGMRPMKKEGKDE